MVSNDWLTGTSGNMYAPQSASPTTVRNFATGATRSNDALRDDPEGYLSPLVIDRYNQYMSKHRLQADGKVRESDNWQKGMPLTSYMKGMWRHFLHLWTRHRGWAVRDRNAAPYIQEDLCAIIFNAQGYLHTLLVREQPKQSEKPNADDVVRVEQEERVR